jgi:hypothetical protein
LINLFSKKATLNEMVMDDFCPHCIVIGGFTLDGTVEPQKDKKIQELRSAIVGLQEAASPFVTMLAMIEAHLECSEQEPLKDSDVLMQFMGSGASNELRVGDFRQLRNALAATMGMER